MAAKKGNTNRLEKHRVDIGLRYLEKYPDLPTLTLAKLLHKDEPLNFLSIANARSFIRHYRGLNARKPVCVTKFITDDTQPKNPWVLKIKSHTPAVVKWKLPIANKKLLCLFDVHIPFQDNDALQLALDYGEEQGIDSIFLGGDLADIWELSDHEKNPNERVSVVEEFEVIREFLVYLRDRFKGKPIYYKPGNHEQRWERFFMRKAPELYGFTEFRLDVILKLGELGIEYLPHNSITYAGKLLLEHGDKIKGSGGVNPARTALLRFKRPVIVGHFHRSTSVNDNVYDGENRMAWSSGCLCGLSPNFLPLNEWIHGFAIVDLHEGGNFTMHNKIIINGKVH